MANLDDSLEGSGFSDEEHISYPQPHNIRAFDGLYKTNPALAVREIERAHGEMKYNAKYGKSKQTKRSR